MSKELTDVEKALLVVVSEGCEAGKDEDTIKFEMIQAGATFKNVSRLYDKFLVLAGYEMSKEEKDAIVDDVLEDCAFDTEEAFLESVDALMTSDLEADEKAARAALRSYARRTKQEVYTPPKGEGNQRSAFINKYFDALVANPAMTEEEARAYIHGTGDHAETSDNVKRYEKTHQNVRELANKIWANVNSTEAEAA